MGHACENLRGMETVLRLLGWSMRQPGPQFVKTDDRRSEFRERERDSGAGEKRYEGWGSRAS
jgi:hypothetical protein